MSQANVPLSGAREARPNFFRRIVARAQAQELAAFVVPGPEVARAAGVDLEAAGLGISATPRHAGVLVLVGGLPPGLKKAAAVAYAQMPRPRAILAIGSGDISPLPGPDVSIESGQEEAAAGVAELRRFFAGGAFSEDAADFDVDAIRTQTEYVCPMHPQVVRDEPGTCPICGMDLGPREAAGADAHGGMDPSGHGMDFGNMLHEDTSHGSMEQVGPDETGAEADSGGHVGYEGHGNHAGMGHAGGDGGQIQHESMDHGGMSGMDHGGPGGMGHGHMDHGDMGFMSMVEMTKDVPRSSDGLQMEWLEGTAFGPLFPGLPGGLSLRLTLDGDTVARAEAEGLEGRPFGRDLAGPAGALADRLARLDPLSPVAYRVLALRAVEDASGVEPDRRTALARVGALERERATSHLGWLSLFGCLIGYRWLEDRAGNLQLALVRADNAGEVARLRGEVAKLVRRVEGTPLIRRRLGGVGVLPEGADPLGPVARARGVSTDARADDEVYRSLGFEPVVLGGDDALSRLRVRLAEIEGSLELVGKAGNITLPWPAAEGGPRREGSATVETSRGAATLRVNPVGDDIVSVELDEPSARHFGLVGDVTEGRELADALVGVASLDPSPWGVAR